MSYPMSQPSPNFNINSVASPGGRWLNKKTGLFDKISSALFGNKESFDRMGLQNPQQEQFLSQLLGQLGGSGKTGQAFDQSQDYLQRMLSGNPEAYNQWAQPHLTQFNEQIVPRLAERFAGLGGGMGGGALGSSGFGQAIGGAGSQLQSNLAGLYAQLQQQASQQAMGQYNNMGRLGLATQPFENIHRPGSGGIFGGFASGAAQGAGQAGGMAGMMKLLPFLMG